MHHSQRDSRDRGKVRFALIVPSIANAEHIFDEVRSVELWTYAIADVVTTTDDYDMEWTIAVHVLTRLTGLEPFRFS